MSIRPRWEDPFSPEGKREATSKILTGTNFRLFFEGITRRKLIKTYRELANLAKQHPHDDDEWKESIREIIRSNKNEKDLRYWLIGLAKKTAANIGINRKDYPTVFDQLIDDIETLPSKIPTRDTALLAWAGVATLTIRGSEKAKIGRQLERSIARAALTIIGLDEAKSQFQLNVEADNEVARETDAEITTPRGKIRMEVGLIGKGNSEVVGDKINRVGKNGIVLFDLLPTKSGMWQNAKQEGVKMVQMRNCHPVEELRQHLHSLRVPVRSKSISLSEVENSVMETPLEIFR